MMKLKKETLETVKNYLLRSILPSGEVQQLVALLNEATEVEEEPKNKTK
jgi:hypothetical protein